MAFNLNKDEAPKSKFDLSKNDAPSGGNGEKPKSKTWLYALLGILLVGGLSWYLLSKPKSDNVAENDSSSPASVGSNSNPAASNGQSEAPDNASEGSAPNSSPENNTSSDVTKTPAAAENTKTESPKVENRNIINSNATAAKLNNKVPASFASASSALNSIDESLVNDIIAFLGKNSNASITINGYASSEGDLTVNQQLSQSRADAFKNYLISKGIAANKIESIGKGIENPIASNDDEAGRQKNRRVEIITH